MDADQIIRIVDERLHRIVVEEIRQLNARLALLEHQLARLQEQERSRQHKELSQIDGDDNE
jgi:hypothetical protein